MHSGTQGLTHDKLLSFLDPADLKCSYYPVETFRVLKEKEIRQHGELNRPGFTGGQNSRRIARYGTDIKEEDLEAVFTRVPRTCGAVGDGTPR